MKASAFSYARATSIGNALELLIAHGDKAKVLSGGQSLMPAMNLRLISPELIVDIGELAELRGIAVNGNVVRIGALTRHVDLARSPEIATHAPLLTQAIGHVAHPAIRNRGTIGGSLAHADPASELPACMVALAGHDCGERSAWRTPHRGRGFFHRDLPDRADRAGIADRRRTAGVAERTRRISLMNSRGGMATTPSSAWRHRRSCAAKSFRIFARCFLLSAIGRCWPRPLQDCCIVRSRRHCWRTRGGAGRRARTRGRPAGVGRDAPASCETAAGPLRGGVARPSRSCRGRGRVTAPMAISLHVNGEAVDAQVLPRLNLADFLREHLQLTGTHVGCEHGVCGACTVRVNGDIVRSCLTLAVQADNASVETIEGLSDSGEIADLQAAFRDRNALAMRLLHAGNVDGGAGSAETGVLAEPATDPRASRPAITAAVPVIRRSSTRSRRRRGRASGVRHERGSRWSLATGSAELLYRQGGPAAQSRAADAGTRALCQRHGAAADGACDVPALASCACQHRCDRCGCGTAHPRRHRGGDRQGTGDGHHAMGRRAVAPEGSQIRAPACDRDRPCVLAGRGRCRGRGDQPCGSGRRRGNRLG